MKNYISYFLWGGPFNAISTGSVKLPKSPKQGLKDVVTVAKAAALPFGLFHSCSGEYCNPPTSGNTKPDHGGTDLSQIPNYNPQERVAVLKNSVNWSSANPDLKSVFVDTICNTYTGCKKVPYTHAAVYMPAERVEGKKASNNWGQITDPQYITYIDHQDLEKGYYKYNPNKVDTLIGWSKWHAGENLFDPDINKTIQLESYFK